MKYAYKTSISDRIKEDNIGQLICLDVPLARDGVYEYSSDEVFGDGRYHTVKLYRDWEEVRKLKYTLEGKPFVELHPDRVTDITIDNIDDFKVGHAQNIREDKMTVDGKEVNILVGDLFVDDKEVIRKIKAKELRDISLGYFYEIDSSDPNRIKQTNMIAEHIALVPAGRAGISKILDNDTVNLKLINIGSRLEYLFFSENTELKPGFKLLEGNGKVYGQYKFTSEIDLLSATPITKQLAGFIIKNNPTKNLILVNKDGLVVEEYLRGKKQTTTGEESIEDFMTVDEFNTNEKHTIFEDDDFIPEPFVSNNPNWFINDIIILGDLLTPLIRKLDRNFRTQGDNYRGTEWEKIVALIVKYADAVEAWKKQDLPSDKYDGEYLVLAEQIATASRRFKKKAYDEIMTTMIVSVFSNEEVNMSIVSSKEEAIKYCKDHKKTVRNNESVDLFIDNANEVSGVYIIKYNDFEDTHIAVAEVLSEDVLDVYIFEGLEELNKGLGEFFKNVEEAYQELNSREGRFSKTAMIIL